MSRDGKQEDGKYNLTNVEPNSPSSSQKNSSTCSRDVATELHSPKVKFRWSGDLSPEVSEKVSSPPPGDQVFLVLTSVTGTQFPLQWISHLGWYESENVSLCPGYHSGFLLLQNTVATDLGLCNLERDYKVDSFFVNPHNLSIEIFVQSSRPIQFWQHIPPLRKRYLSSEYIAGSACLQNIVFCFQSKENGSNLNSDENTFFNRNISSVGSLTKNPRLYKHCVFDRNFNSRWISLQEIPCLEYDEKLLHPQLQANEIFADIMSEESSSSHHRDSKRLHCLTSRSENGNHLSRTKRSWQRLSDSNLITLSAAKHRTETFSETDVLRSITLGTLERKTKEQEQMVNDFLNSSSSFDEDDSDLIPVLVSDMYMTSDATNRDDPVRIYTDRSIECLERSTSPSLSRSFVQMRENEVESGVKIIADAKGLTNENFNVFDENLISSQFYSETNEIDFDIDTNEAGQQDRTDYPELVRSPEIKPQIEKAELPAHGQSVTILGESGEVGLYGCVITLESRSNSLDDLGSPKAFEDMLVSLTSNNCLNDHVTDSTVQNGYECSASVDRVPLNSTKVEIDNTVSRFGQVLQMSERGTKGKKTISEDKIIEDINNSILISQSDIGVNIYETGKENGYSRMKSNKVLNELLVAGEESTDIEDVNFPYESESCEEGRYPIDFQGVISDDSSKPVKEQMRTVVQDRRKSVTPSSITGLSSKQRHRASAKLRLHAKSTRVKASRPNEGLHKLTQTTEGICLQDTPMKSEPASDNLDDSFFHSKVCSSCYLFYKNYNNAQTPENVTNKHSTVRESEQNLPGSVFKQTVWHSLEKPCLSSSSCDEYGHKPIQFTTKITTSPSASCHYCRLNIKNKVNCDKISLDGYDDSTLGSSSDFCTESHSSSSKYHLKKMSSRRRKNKCIPFSSIFQGDSESELSATTGNVSTFIKLYASEPIINVKHHENDDFEETATKKCLSKSVCKCRDIKCSDSEKRLQKSSTRKNFHKRKCKLCRNSIIITDANFSSRDHFQTKQSFNADLNCASTSINKCDKEVSAIACSQDCEAQTSNGKNFSLGYSVLPNKFSPPMHMGSKQLRNLLSPRVPSNDENTVERELAKLEEYFHKLQRIERTLESHPNSSPKIVPGDFCESLSGKNSLHDKINVSAKLQDLLFAGKSSWASTTIHSECRSSNAQGLPSNIYGSSTVRDCKPKVNPDIEKKFDGTEDQYHEAFVSSCTTEAYREELKQKSLRKSNSVHELLLPKVNGLHVNSSIRKTTNTSDFGQKMYSDRVKSNLGELFLDSARNLDFRSVQNAKERRKSSEYCFQFMKDNHRLPKSFSFSEGLNSFEHNLFDDTSSDKAGDSDLEDSTDYLLLEADHVVTRGLKAKNLNYPRKRKSDLSAYMKGAPQTIRRRNYSAPLGSLNSSPRLTEISPAENSSLNERSHSLPFLPAYAADLTIGQLVKVLLPSVNDNFKPRFTSRDSFQSTSSVYSIFRPRQYYFTSGMPFLSRLRSTSGFVSESTLETSCGRSSGVAFGRVLLVADTADVEKGDRNGIFDSIVAREPDVVVIIQRQQSRNWPYTTSSAVVQIPFSKVLLAWPLQSDLSSGKLFQ